MVKSSVSSESLHEETQREARWSYDEYYIGNTDEENRRSGQGENHWTGAESIEWHVGCYFRDTMHGYGDYRWRYKDREGIFVTYEGRFFTNQLHGYGVMSYPDGRVFTGLFFKDLRWGPGEERSATLYSNVGLWRGIQLARLTWRPSTPSIAPDFTTGPMGAPYLDPFRIVLKTNVKIPGQTNSAIDLLKQYGADPVQASKVWQKLYPANCTNLDSVLCHKDTFLNDYYKGEINILEQITDENEEEDPIQESTRYFAWNNSYTTIHMMKHSYQHDSQRKTTALNITNVLSGPRRSFRPAAKHEYDCRTTLMASYLGHINKVAQLVNEEDVYVDISDMQGNTALMYATCGDQSDIIHFLVEAGANVNNFNDSCCTPLGVALIRYLCAAKDIKPNTMVASLLPAVAGKMDKAIPQESRRASEWNIKRELPLAEKTISSLKEITSNSIKNIKSASTTAKSQAFHLAQKKSTMKTTKDSTSKANQSSTDRGYDSDDEDFTEERRQYLSINEEFLMRVNNLFESKLPAEKNARYIFDVQDMMKDIEAVQAEQAKTAEKPSKKASVKISKEKDLVKDDFLREPTLTSIDGIKTEMLSKIQMTIFQLLLDGADPRLVTSPQPALLIAVKSGCSDLVKQLVLHGVNVNEKFPQMLDYTALDVVISDNYDHRTIDMIRVLLEAGADVNHRFHYPVVHTGVQGDVHQSGEMDIPGPTLLHVLLSKKMEFEFLEDIRNQIIELLLQFNADPCAIFSDRSPMDIALTKSVAIMEIFINNPGTDLNAIINSHNETILVKMFTRDYFKLTAGMNRFPVLTNLLLRGADPLIECYYGETKYGNIFEFAKNILSSMMPVKSTSPAQGSESSKAKIKGNEKEAKGKSKAKLQVQTTQSNINRSRGEQSDSMEYTEALDLITECARILHIRWIQSKLVKELIDVIYKYKHRTWNMILKEHMNANNVSLWVSTQRCIEIWDVLKTTKKKRYTDEVIFKHLLCIVQYYQKRLKDKLLITTHMTAAEKNLIDSDVNGLLKEYKVASKLGKEIELWKKIYVKPELASKHDKKFNVCFECILPLPPNTNSNCIICDMCQLVSFCSIVCLHGNIERANCHPCSPFLLEKYFPPSPEGSLDDIKVPT